MVGVIPFGMRCCRMRPAVRLALQKEPSRQDRNRICRQDIGSNRARPFLFHRVSAGRRLRSRFCRDGQADLLIAPPSDRERDAAAIAADLKAAFDRLRGAGSSLTHQPQRTRGTRRESLVIFVDLRVFVVNAFWTPKKTESAPMPHRPS